MGRKITSHHTNRPLQSRSGHPHGRDTMTIDSLALAHLLAVAVWLFWTIGPIAFPHRDG